MYNLTRQPAFFEVLPGPPPRVFVEHIEASKTRAGWTVGGGVEWAFSQNWSTKIEYDFYDFGTRDVTLKRDPYARLVRQTCRMSG